MHFGGHEALIVVGLIVVLFGAKKLPELGKSLGQGIKEFKKSSKGLLDDVEEEQTVDKSQADSAS